MHQLISRPAIYLVLGIGVLALLISQFKNTDNQARTSVSELDPFASLENLSGQNLAISTPEIATAVQAPAVLASVNPMEMVRDETTAPDGYQQTAATPLRDVVDGAQSVANSIEEVAVDMPAKLDIGMPNQLTINMPEQLAVDTPDQLSEIDLPAQLDEIDMGDVELPNVNQINTPDDGLTTLELDEPISLDDAPETRYELDETPQEIAESSVMDTISTALTGEPQTGSTAMTEEPQTITQPAPVMKNSRARVNTGDSMRPRGWRKNPFITESNDVVDAKPVGDAVEIETSFNQSFENNNSDSVMMISSELDETSQIATVANFEPKDAPTTVSIIPSADQPLQSVVSGYTDQPNGGLPIVIGLPDSVAHKAVHNIEYGKSLSRRGASFAARQEFYSALRILSQAHDTSAGGTSYTRALRDAIVALKEAEDFIVSDTETQIGLNVDAVIDGHSTKIISSAEATNMTAIGAMQRYFSFASNQLRVSCGQNPVAAEALYCLGKLHTVQAKFGSNASKLDIAKAIVFHQAAMASDQSNFRSANELGVLMANSGRLNESQSMLKRSLQIAQLPQAWQNLAVVHQRSGQHQLAQLAQQEFMITSHQQATGLVQNTIRWVEPAIFNKGTPLEFRQRTAQAPQGQQPVQQQGTVKPTIGQRLKGLLN